MKKLIMIFMFLTISILNAQSLKGYITENNEGNIVPLVGVNIFWQDTNIGTATDENGIFQIEKPNGDGLTLIVSYIGYKSDSIKINKEDTLLELTLSASRELEEVVVNGVSRSTQVFDAEPMHIQHISGKELTKAACCTLAESFETNASVDVSFTDALSGAKQIQLLGLAGIYSQIMIENMPSMRGLGRSYGINYIPGPWMESIQISKGTSSVINGFESVSGQINVEYKKPDDSEKFYLNLYQNNEMKSDINMNSAYEFNENLSTSVLLHGDYYNKNVDDNGDGFLDKPRSKQYTFINRWKYKSENLFSQLSINYLNENKDGGQKSFTDDQARSEFNPYGININADRYEIFMKIGYIFDHETNSSLGFQTSYTSHNQTSFFGLNNYDADQRSFYANLIYKSNFGSDTQNYFLGVSYIGDKIDENLNGIRTERIEKIPGLFLQAALNPVEDLNLIAGIRSDFHNIHGTFYTPRLHLKYDFNAHTIFRASVGKGFRTANVIAENNSLLATSKEILFMEDLEMEEAFNFGFNITRYFNIWEKELTLNLEFYRTEFINQIIIDRETDLNKIKVSNLEGDSYSNNYQLELNYMPLRGLDLLAALRYSDVKYSIENKLYEKPLISKYKALLNLSYISNLRLWQYDLTMQFNGDGRLPNNSVVGYNDFSSFTIINAQITRKFRGFDIYLGGENLTDFTQDNPILSAESPFSNNFDASIIWGPIMGRKIYLGIKYTLN
ncbi:MAG: TonB-dependent receptor [Melioribacteraceae bacterium]|nr:TonB-dependent receptor [Melioribacteraceae bacterium]